MAFEDIEQLKGKIAKDPSSKLFVPLAEEYRKAGMFDEAIDVLQKGLEVQPSYMSARVVLGKIYIEKSMLEEAKTEFEKVIQSIPDNLFAHKKLAEIYKELGDPEKAVEAYETVIKLSPQDEDAKINLEALTGSDQPEFERGKGVVDDTSAQLREEAPGERQEEVAAIQEEEEVSVADHRTEEEPSEQPVETVREEEIVEDGPSSQQQDDSFAGADFESFKNAIQEERVNLNERGEERGTDSSMFYAGKDTPVSEEIQDIDRGKDLKNPLNTVKHTEQASPEGDVIYSAFKKAEEMIAQSRFDDAFQLYNELMGRYPGDKKILQKLEELRAYLTMSGKGKGKGQDRDGIINKLNHFLEGVRKRKDEFFRSP